MKSKWIVVLLVVAAGLVVGCVACRQEPAKPAANNGQKIAYYTCAMHPSVRADKPGACPICGMALTPVYTNAPATP